MVKCKRIGILASLAALVSTVALIAQSLPTKTSDNAKESFIIERTATRVAFENDGSWVRTTETSIRIQSDAGLQRYGVLGIRYAGSSQRLSFEYARVHKPDGTVVETSPDGAQDVASE